MVGNNAGKRLYFTVEAMKGHHCSHSLPIMVGLGPIA